MSGLRVLFINQYFPPDTAATAKMAALVVNALAKQHRVTVLAGRPSYDPTERHRPYLFRAQRMGGAVVARVGSTAYSRHNMRGRLANYVSYLMLAAPYAGVAGADVVVAMTDPPVAGIMGALVAAARRRPFVYNVRDLYPDMAVAGGLLRPGAVATAWERLHRWALGRADRVVVLGDDMRVRVEAKGVPGERVVVVRDGASLPAAAPRRDGAVAPQVRGNDRFVVLHAGNVGFYGAWETLVRAAAQLSEEGVGFVFVGGGAAAGRVRALAASTGGPIRFLPFRPASEVPQVLAAADLHLVTVRRGLEGVVVPSKLFGILAAGRPVLAVAPEESDAARIVRRYRCGFVADPDSPGAVAHVVRQALTAPGELLEMGVRARAAAADFEQQRELDRLVRVVEEAARGGSRRRPGAPGQKSEAIR